MDETGRRPQAPLPAYQQVIKGTVWNDLTIEDLIYAPRNPRPDHLYGFSPVEQIIVTVNTVLRRQSAQLGYFTEGNVPAGILNVPAGWTADQITTMQSAWDARMEGNLPSKSKVQWVPEGTKYQALKDSPLKDEFDEWLYRIVCFAFSLPPTAFVKQMNRATAQQGSDSGKEEGIESRKLWWKRIADSVIQDDFGYDDLEWGWTEDVEVDALKQAQIDDLNLRNGSTFINEVRDTRGLDVVDGGAEPLIYLVTGPVPLGKAVEDALDPPEPVVVAPPPLAGGPHPQAPGQGGGNPQKPAGGEEQPQEAHASNVAPKDAAAKLAKAASTSVDRPLVRRAAARAKRATAAVLKRAGDDVAGQVEEHLKRFGKVAPADDSSIGPTLAAQIASQVNLDDLTSLDLTEDLLEVATDSAAKGLAQVGVKATDDLTNQVNDRAVIWAKGRAAELVTAKGPQNVVDSTRDMIREVIGKGLEANVGARAIAEQVQESTAFSPERAALIADTEIRRANSQGALAGYKVAASTGVKVKKAWSTSEDDLVDEDICQANADQGPIELDEVFQSGDDATPGHPKCRCSLTPVVEEDDDTDADDSGQEDS